MQRKKYFLNKVGAPGKFKNRRGHYLDLDLWIHVIKSRICLMSGDPDYLNFKKIKEV
jgi:hypothetical protein